MTNQNQPQTEPPQPPDIKRKIKLYAFQYIGLPLILLIPFLAMLGVFGESFTETEQGSDDLGLKIQYPTRYRYKLINSMTVSVQNKTDTTLPTLVVSFERDYIDQFSTVDFAPTETRITDSTYEVELKDIPPGETRVVTVELQGEKYGKHIGYVSAEAEGLSSVRIRVSTIIFP